MYCHAGCSLENILASVGLTEKDLFNDGQQKSNIEAEYIYRDENNNPLYKVIRFCPKSFTQAKYVNGEWIFKMQDVRYVLYNLRNVIKSDMLPDNDPFEVELIKKGNETIGILNGKIKQYNRVINQVNGILEKNNKLLLKIEKSKPNIFKYVFSLGIYAYLISQKRKAKVNNVILISNEKASLLIKQREEKTSEVSYCEKRISDITNEKILKEKNIAAQKLVEFLRYEKKLSQIEPLVDKIKIDSSFVKLKLLGGFAYEKIIGCYIIHNVEKDKYYVGQSKDVIKRIKQHFKGTVPNNQIFAEDYYTSCMDQKEDIFEFKIIPCNTKDELDLMERNLISQYDSWNSGYNGTSGNT